jgi:hypothetical protein
VKLLEITINFSQIFAFIWTMIAIAISFIIVFAPVSPFFTGASGWQMGVLLFFVSLLVLTLPVYLLLALWHVLSERSDPD